MSNNYVTYNVNIYPPAYTSYFKYSGPYNMTIDHLKAEYRMSAYDMQDFIMIHDHTSCSP